MLDFYLTGLSWHKMFPGEFYDFLDGINAFNWSLIISEGGAGHNERLQNSTVKYRSKYRVQNSTVQYRLQYRVKNSTVQQRVQMDEEKTSDL